MQGIVQAAIEAAESNDQRQARIEANVRQVIADLEKGLFNTSLFDKIAEMIERAAKEQKESRRYRRLCLHLRSREVGQRVEARAAKALRALWGVS